jgi:cycloeucalenol cycloisomerase
METLTISSFPYYSFKDRFLAYTLGSAFYGIYFIVSFPVFYRIDEKHVLVTRSGIKVVEPTPIYSVVMEAMGSGMIVLLLLDICRLIVNIPLNIPGQLYYIYKPSS